MDWYFHHHFSFLIFSSQSQPILINQKLFLVLFPDPVGHFVFCRLCDVENGEWLPPSLLGWYYWIMLSEWCPPVEYFQWDQTRQLLSEQFSLYGNSFSNSLLTLLFARTSKYLLSVQNIIKYTGVADSTYHKKILISAWSSLFEQNAEKCRILEPINGNVK